ncbi:hypothetical protein LWI29_010604 [Acer saccharum]|uniref:Uncharacterized protein n=1 Tax=Acer saccharum TaxID=4024 RepID=A0AA39SLS9_ACESA|nr:hypothetical protein LWI29_010604 [Acer saccharum]
MRQSKKFFAMKDHSNEKALKRFDSKRVFNTYYSSQKGSFSGSGAEPDLGPVTGRDYEPFMPEGDEEVTCLLKRKLKMRKTARALCS